MALPLLSNLNWKTSYSAIPKIKQKHGHWHEIFTAVRQKKRKKEKEIKYKKVLLDLAGGGVTQLHEQ